MSYPKFEKPYQKELKVGDKIVTIKIGKFCEQTAAAVLATCGETVVHSTIALGNEVDWGYFPLNVEYFEKLYAGGIIKGSRWVKREGRPSDDAILKARVIDRSIRPLFPEGIKNQVQVVNTIFSYDQENDPDMLALLASTIALSISQIPFLGPIAGIRLGYKKDEKKFVVNPTLSEREGSDLDLIVSGGAKSIVMVEAGANEVSEALIIDALAEAQKVLAKVCAQIEEVVKEVGREKIDLIPVVEAERAKLLEDTQEHLAKKYQAAIQEVVEKQGRLEPSGLDTLLEQMNEDVSTRLGEQAATVIEASDVKDIVKSLMKQAARQMILEKQIRPDGRKPDQVRPIWSEIDVFPRTHGSAMFKRGSTQAVTVTTLGNPSLALHIEDLQGEEERHYIHHYNMPPFASGEAGRFGWAKRREIGHGSLAERALLPMIPSQEEFPYTIRVVSEILSCNGSTSQAAICGSTLSLMASGVPLKKPVSGIAMGLMSDGKKEVILTDIQGLEDHVGDMDFKIAGTKDGVTAIQMDIKLTGLSRKILEKALEQAKVGRLHILEQMLKTIDEPRKKLSPYAPKVAQITIPADRIGELIGPGGKVIKKIIEVTGAEVNVEENEEEKLGIVNVSSASQEEIDAAMQMINDMMRVLEIGDEFDGKITRIEDYGVFVTLVGDKEGLVHVSAMSVDYISNPRDHYQVGDEVHVRVSEVKEDGKIGLSMLTPEQEQEQKANSRDRRGSGGSGGSYGGGYSGGGSGGSRPGGGRRYSGGGRAGGSRSSSRGGSRGGSRGSSRSGGRSDSRGGDRGSSRSGSRSSDRSKDDRGGRSDNSRGSRRSDSRSDNNRSFGKRSGSSDAAKGARRKSDGGDDAGKQAFKSYLTGNEA